MLYTGDEMGYMMKLDISQLLTKLEYVCEESNKSKANMSPDKHQDDTFLTGTKDNQKEHVTFSDKDVMKVCGWKAHQDAINWVTWVPKLRLVGSSSYDCNVFLWNADSPEENKGVKMGSLVLGNKATAPGQEPDPETKRYRRGWKVQIDKQTRYLEDLEDAKKKWATVQAEYSTEKYKELKKQKENEARRKQGNSVADQNKKRTAEAGLVLDKGARGSNMQAQAHASIQDKDIDDCDEEEKEQLNNKIL